jgi:hypothetical protein
MDKAQNKPKPNKSIEMARRITRSLPDFYAVLRRPDLQNQVSINPVTLTKLPHLA